MGTLATLKLITAKRNNISPVLQRRAKLTRKMIEQIELAKCVADGRTYAITRKKSVKNSDGNRVNLEITKTVRQWWWTQDNGKLAFSVRYGSRVIALNTKSNAVECAGFTELVNALTVIKTVVETGELDEQIEKASLKLRDGFKNITTK